MSVLSKGDGANVDISFNNLIGGSLLTIGSLFSAVYNNLQTYIMSKYNIPPISVSTWGCLSSSIFTSCVSVFFYSSCDFTNSTWQVVSSNFHLILIIHSGMVLYSQQYSVHLCHGLFKQLHVNICDQQWLLYIHAYFQFGQQYSHFYY